MGEVFLLVAEDTATRMATTKLQASSFYMFQVQGLDAPTAAHALSMMDSVLSWSW